MKVELPELKRCCCCVPLRYGLIGWGYIKLVITLLSLSLLIKGLVRYCQSQMRLIRPDIFVMEVTVISVLIFLLVVDGCFTAMFIVGGHRKTAKLLHIYNIYSIVIVCIYTLVYMWSAVNDIHFMVTIAKYIPNGHVLMISIIRVKMILGIAFIGIQMYTIILTKNEINKLRNNMTFRFTNMHAEAGQSAVEHGADQGGAAAQPERTDNQFIGIINQVQDVDRETYDYNKL